MDTNKIEDLISKINKLDNDSKHYTDEIAFINGAVEILQAKINEWKAFIKDNNTEKDILQKELLEELKNENLYEYKSANGSLVAYRSCVDSVDYKDENKLIKFLEDNSFTNLLKYTPKLKKNDFKQKLKTDVSFNNLIKQNDLVSIGKTEYATVTTEVNYNLIKEAYFNK